MKKLSTFYGTRRFLPTVPISCHHSLSRARSIQSIPPHLISLRFILILCSHPYLGLQSGLFPSGLPTKTLYVPLLSSICATCPAHLILLDSHPLYLFTNIIYVILYITFYIIISTKICINIHHPFFNYFHRFTKFPLPHVINPSLNCQSSIQSSPQHRLTTKIGLRVTDHI